MFTDAGLLEEGMTMEQKKALVKILNESKQTAEEEIQHRRQSEVPIIEQSKANEVSVYGY